MPERLECEVLQKARYINTLTFLVENFAVTQSHSRSFEFTPLSLFLSLCVLTSLPLYQCLYLVLFLRYFTSNKSLEILVRGRSKSLKMAIFDRLHTRYYSSSIGSYFVSFRR